MRLRLRIPIMLTVLLLVGALALSFVLLARAPALLHPGQLQKAELVASSLGRKVERALALGIPPGDLEGIPQILDDTLASNPDLARVGLVLADTPGWQAGRDPHNVEAKFPIRADGQEVGLLAVTPDPAFVTRSLRDIAVDLAIILLVIALIGLELSRLILGRHLSSLSDAAGTRLAALARGQFRALPPPDPAGGLDRAEIAALHKVDAALDARRARIAALQDRAVAAGDIAALTALQDLRRRHELDRTTGTRGRGADDIRAPLFLFMFAQELSRPFLPGWAVTLSEESDWLSPALAASLPLTVFMAMVALLQLPLAARTARWGRGRSFRLGAALGAAGFALGALAGGPAGLVLSQAVAAVGFALVFVSCQGHILDTTDAGGRIQGLAVMVGAIMVAGLCGPAVGGLAAGALGVPATFLVMALIALGSLAAGWTSIPAKAERTAFGTQGAGAAPRGSAIRNPALMVLMVGCALPAKLLLFATCFYLLPLQMTASGASMAEIGRMQMIYPVLTVLLIPVFSGLSQRSDKRLPFVLAGASLAALALALPFGLGQDHPGIWLLGLVLVLFGIAQALSITPQGAAVGELARRHGGPPEENAAYGLYRLIERGGSALGPVVAALMLPVLGFAQTLAALAALSIVGAALAGLVLLASRPVSPVPESLSP